MFSLYNFVTFFHTHSNYNTIRIKTSSAFLSGKETATAEHLFVEPSSTYFTYCFSFFNFIYASNNINKTPCFDFFIARKP